MLLLPTPTESQTQAVLSSMLGCTVLAASLKDNVLRFTLARGGAQPGDVLLWDQTPGPGEEVYWEQRRMQCPDSLSTLVGGKLTGIKMVEGKYAGRFLHVSTGSPALVVVHTENDQGLYSGLNLAAAVVGGLTDEDMPALEPERCYS